MEKCKINNSIQTKNNNKILSPNLGFALTINEYVPIHGLKSITKKELRKKYIFNEQIV